MLRAVFLTVRQSLSPGTINQMNDAHNLAWKLAHHNLGYSKSDLLKNYEEERLPNARYLVASDKRANRSDIALEKKVKDSGNLLLVQVLNILRVSL